MAIPKRTGRVLILLGLVALSFGCLNPATFYFLLFGLNAKEQPKFKLASDDKEIKVVVVSSLSKEMPLEFLRFDQDLTERFVLHLRQRLKENKDKVTIVPTSKVHAFKDRRSDWQTMPLSEIGKHFGVDYVISLDINGLNMYEHGCRQLLRGRANISVSVVDVSQPEGEGAVFNTEYSCEYPKNGPKDIGFENNPASFRVNFMKHVAKELSRLFAAYPPDELHDIDD